MTLLQLVTHSSTFCEIQIFISVLKVPTETTFSPVQSSPVLPILLLKDSFPVLISFSYPNRRLPSVSFPLGFSSKFLYAFHLSHTHRTSHPPHFTWFDRRVYWSVKTVKLLTVQFSPVCPYCFRLRSKYFPEHPVTDSRQSLHFPWSNRPIFVRVDEFEDGYINYN